MRSRKGPRGGAIIILRHIEKHEWIFELPRITEQVDERLEEGIDWMDANLRRSESIFRKLIAEYPEHIDAYHHLGLTLEQVGRTDDAFHTWEQAVTTAFNFFPPHFSIQRDRLQWGFVENRPFLRLYQAYGLQLVKRGATEEGLEVFENLLSLNPNDNQGARASAVGCYFELKQPEGVLSVCKQYPDDAMEHLVYGRALALFQLGKLKQSGSALDLAIKSFPLIATELLKTNHGKPKAADERHVTLGSQEQAYLYWEEQGKHWTKTPGAVDFVKSHLPGL